MEKLVIYFIRILKNIVFEVKVGEAVKTRKALLESGVLLLLLALTLVFLLRNQDMTRIIDVIKGCNYMYIVIAFGMMALYAYLAGYEVYMFLKSRGYKMSAYRCFKYGFTEIFFSAITPSSTGGQPMMAVAMRNDGYPLTETTPALLAITGLYKTGVMLLGIIACMFYGSRIFQMTNDSWVIALFCFGFVANIVIIVFVCLFLFSNKCIWSIFRAVLFIGCKLRLIKNRERVEKYFKSKKEEYMACANYMREYPSIPVKVFLVALIQRLALASVAAFVYKAMGITTFGVSFVYIMAIQIIVAIAVELMPLPGAVGISETVFLSFYLTVYGTPELLNAGLLLTRGINFYLLFLASAVFVNSTHFVKVYKSLRRRDE